MAWNWLDVFVVLLAVGQIGLGIAIGVIVGRIKNGPLSRLSTAVGRNLTAGKKLIESGTKAGAAAAPHLGRTRDALVRIPRAFRPIQLSDAPITYSTARTPLAVLSALRGKPGKAGRRAPSQGLAEKLGLVPPVWKKITPLLGYAGTALSVVREVRKQMPEIKRALSERDSG